MQDVIDQLRSARVQCGVMMKVCMVGEDGGEGGERRGEKGGGGLMRTKTRVRRRGMRGRSRFNDCIGGRLMVWCCEIGDQLNVFKHHKASQHSRYVCAPPPLSLPSLSSSLLLRPLSA